MAVVTVVISLSALVPIGAGALTGAALSREQAHSVVERYLDDRAARATGQHGGASALTGVSLGDSLRRRLVDEAHAIDVAREAFRKSPSQGYRAAEVSVQVTDVREKGDHQVEVRATESTRLYFGHGNPEAPQFEGYQLAHSFVFAESGDDWQIVDATAELGYGPPPVTQAKLKPSATDSGIRSAASAVVPGMVAASTERPQRGAAVDTRTPVTDRAYDYEAMLAYAAKHHAEEGSGTTYNPNYRVYSNDCTNFVSQIMEAGGWEPTGTEFSRTDPRTWFYNPLNEGLTSYSWAAAHNWGLFAQVHSKRTLGLAHIYDLSVSDVLQVDWDRPEEDDVPDDHPVANLDHTMFVTGRLSEPGEVAASEVYLTYHTNNRWNVPFWGRLLTDPADVWYAHRT
ncbi:hypothetical protein SUDANB95_06777 [Actinosynnema sp. ALI-1.44]